MWPPTRVNAVIFDFDKVSILMILAQFIIRWIVKNALRDPTKCLSLTIIHNGWMDSSWSPAFRIQRWTVRTRIVVLHCWIEADFSWMNIEKLISSTANREVYCSRRTTSIKLCGIYSCIKHSQFSSRITCFMPHCFTWGRVLSVREYVFYVFFQISQNMTFYVFWNDVSKSRKRSQKDQVCWMSIEILASKLPDVMGICTYRRLSHTVLSCIVSCDRTSVLSNLPSYWLPVGLIEQLKAEWLSGLWNYTYVFYVFFSKSKNMTFYVFWVVAHVFSNTARTYLFHKFLWPYPIKHTSRHCYLL